jgi:DNA-directed RNA polymerase subunit RPC12/RpoP
MSEVEKPFEQQQTEEEKKLSQVLDIPVIIDNQTNATPEPEVKAEQEVKKPNVSPEGIQRRVKKLKEWHKERNKFEHKCLRCGNKWKGHKKSGPKKCPKCNDRDWRKPYIRKPEGTKYGRENTKQFAPVSLARTLRNGIECMQIQSGEPSMAVYLEKRLKEVGVPEMSDDDLRRWKIDWRKQQAMTVPS